MMFFFIIFAFLVFNRHKTPTCFHPKTITDKTNISYTNTHHSENQKYGYKVTLCKESAYNGNTEMKNLSYVMYMLNTK